MHKMDTFFLLQVISCAYLVVVCKAASNCNELQTEASGNLSSGSYSVTNGNGQAFTIYCQFYSGYGYAFVSRSTDVDVNMTSLYDDASHVIIRHKKTNGLQYTSTMEQLSSHSSLPIMISYNDYSGYARPNNFALTPYIYVGFFPSSIIHPGTRAGWKCNGVEYTYTNCDGNPNSYIVFLFNHNNVSYTNRIGSFNSLLMSCWYSLASAVTPFEYLPDEFFTTFFEVHHGGCGGFATSLAEADITGAAVGVKFDIDECAASTDDCDVNAQCTNTAGSFTCVCNTGYNGNGVTCTDVDECSASTDNCDVNAQCTNTAGSFTCVCNAGYNGNGVTCTDIDECSASTDNCDVNAQCTNTAGSFTCVCNAGYNGTGVTCTDIDECSASTDNCDVNAQCTNTAGSFTCVCNAGYNGTGVTCTDIDECSASTDNCDVNAQCTNTAGSFTCVCKAGYNGNGVTCTDIDECSASTDNCDVNAQCTNTAGSFTCVCNAGYNGTGVTCTDIDECSASTDNCDVNAQCTNTAGSFTCVCKAGYNGNGVTCTDIDECSASTDNCDVNAQCTNTAGSFTCVCNAGYNGTGVTCTDIDECSASTDNCDVNAQCTNTAGSFTCVCNAGYNGTGVTCTDVDECASNPCQNGGQCTNGQNMFTCSCTIGWTGTTCRIGFVCNPDNTIDVSNLPANYSYFAMQNVAIGLDVECNVTLTSSTSITIRGCSKDLDILLTYSTYKEMSTYGLHGGKSLTALVVKCSEIPDNGTVHKVNNAFEADLIISSDTDVAPTYSVDSFLSTNFTTVGSDVTWTITFPVFPVNPCISFAYNILLLLFVTEM